MKKRLPRKMRGSRRRAIYRRMVLQMVLKEVGSQAAGANREVRRYFWKRTHRKQNCKGNVQEKHKRGEIKEVCK